MIAHARGALVILAPDRFAEVHLKLLALAQGAFGGDVFEPVLERLDFGALFEQIDARIFLVKLADFIDAIFDFANGAFEIIFRQAQGGFGAGLHH